MTNKLVISSFNFDEILGTIQSVEYEEVDYKNPPKNYPKYIHARKRVPCGGYRDSYTNEFDCEYYVDFSCEECMCSGIGTFNPWFSEAGNIRNNMKVTRRWLRKRSSIRFLKNHKKFIILKYEQEKSHT